MCYTAVFTLWDLAYIKVHTSIQLAGFTVYRMDLLAFFSKAIGEEYFNSTRTSAVLEVGHMDLWRFITISSQ